MAEPRAQRLAGAAPCQPTRQRPVDGATRLQGRVGAAPSASATAAALAAALLAVLGLRLAVMLGSGAGLHVDEAQYWDWSRQLQWGYFSKPPGVAALIALSTTVAGDGLAGVRWAAMLCWALSAAVVGALAAQMQAHCGRPERAGAAAAWAALLFTGTPAAGLLGLVATTDAPLLLCWSAAMAATWQAWCTGAWRWWAAAGVACGLGLLSKYTTAALVPGWAWLALQAWRLAPGAARRRARAGLALAATLALLLVLPNLAWNAAHDWPTWRHTGAITAAATRAAGQGAALSLLGFAAGQALLLGPVLLGVLVQGLRTAAPAAGPVRTVPQAVHASDAGRSPWWLDVTPAFTRRFALAFVWPLWALAGAQALWAQAQMNWTAPVLAGLCAWAGLAAAQRGWSIRQAALAGAAGVALGLAVAGAPALATPVGASGPVGLMQRLDVWARMRGWAPALQALAPALAACPQCPVVAGERSVLAQAAWAWRDDGRRVLAWPATGRADHHYQLQQALSGQPPRLWWLGPQPPSDVQRQRYAVWTPVAQQQVGALRLGLWLGSAPVAAP